MITILGDQYLNTLNYSADCLVPAAEFTPYRDRIVSQLIKTVQVPGFRPGKVPAKVAMQNLDPEKVNQTVIEESINKYLPEFLESIKEKLAKDNRIVLNQQITFKTNTGIQDNGDFMFSMVFGLLPEVDLTAAKALKIPTIENSDIPELLSTDKFIERELELLLKNVNELRIKESKEVFESIEEAFEKEEILQKQYTSLEDFKKLLTNVYEQELANTKTRLQNDQLIAELISVTPDFDIPGNLIEEEVKRITEAMQARSEEAKVDLDTIWNQSGFNRNNLKINNVDELRAAVMQMLNNEFKLMYILRFIYETMLDKKISQDEIEDLVKNYKQNPQAYNIPADMPVEEMENRAFDQRMRAVAFDKFRELISSN